MDGNDWYEYCRSNPLRYVDPDGRTVILLRFLLGYAFFQSLPPPDAPYIEVFDAGVKGGFLFITGGAVIDALRFSHALRMIEKKGFNFTNTTIERMGTKGRYVPVYVMRDTIQSTKGLPDPQGTRALMYYTQMYKNGKLYNLEVLYDYRSNTILHFEYTRKAIGPLAEILK